VDPRLIKRHQQLVLEHMNSSAGLKALPDKISSFASTQATWRFYITHETDVGYDLQTSLNQHT